MSSDPGSAPPARWIAPLGTIAGATLAGALMAAAGSTGGLRIGGLPVFTVCVALAYLVNWAAFVPAYLRRTERVSGIPLLESRGRAEWGTDPAYQEYLARTPVLMPRPPRRRRSG